jgi:formylglycine-generating enzyme required for sulfatase activity
MGQSEVTQGQWRRLMGASVFAPADGDVAVYNVSWNDAMEFCHRLTAREQARGRVPPGYEIRLSTEAEWEYACRAGSPTEVKLTDDNGWSWTNSRASGVTAAHPKAQKASNHWGLHDMLGNVWEWCFDWYGPYPGGSEIDPAGSAPGLAHVMRGGCWWDAAATCTSSVRGWAGPDDRYVSVGFRVVLGPCIQAPRLPPTTKGYNISDSVENPPL